MDENKNKKTEREVKKSFSDKFKEKQKARHAKRVREQIRKRAYANKSINNDNLDDKDNKILVNKNFSKRKKSKISFNRIILILIAAIIIAVIVLLITNRDLVSCENFGNMVTYGVFNKDSEHKFPATIEGTSVTVGNFNRMGNNLCYTSDTSFTIMNNYGRIVYSSPISYINPIMECSDNYALVYALGDKKFEINSKDKQIFKGEAPDNIYVAAINNNGMYALVTKSDGYLSKLYVYNQENKEIYAYSFADYYITSVDINSKGDRILLSGISALEGSEISAIYVLDITKSTPLHFSEHNSNIIYKVSFLGDNNGCAIGNNACYGFKITDEKYKQVSYGGKFMTAYAPSRESKIFFVSLSRSGDGRNCTIYTFNNVGEIINTNETTLKIDRMSAYKNRVGALSEKSIHLFDKSSRSGHAISVKKPAQNIHSFVLYTRKDAYLLSATEVSRIDL